ncbi:MAG: hypothetical protein H5U40_00425, partial [Polyangiaceae bacterium]|nr:hypothetical protein [Polyangiaceae bacterium]
FMFELTHGVDPVTVTDDSVAFYDLGGETPRRIPSTLRVMNEAGEAPCLASPAADDCKHIIIVPDPLELPLDTGRTYAVIVGSALRAHDGSPVEPMPIGHFMMSEHPLAIDGSSQVSVIDDEDAVLLEGVRRKIAPLLDALGRDQLVTAWPFTTLTVDAELENYSNMAERLATDARPRNLVTRTVREAAELLFPGLGWTITEVIYKTRMESIDRVVTGTIPSPYFLGQDRRLRQDGSYEMEDVSFMLTIPKGIEEGSAVPVAFFGHGLVTDSRWVLPMAGELARRGYAVISIDMPFHGSRTVCVERSLIAIPNFLPEALRIGIYEDELLQFAPCASGSSATCSPEGECIAADGSPDELTVPPVINMPIAGGAAFLEVEEIPYIKDHFLQGLVEMSSLHRAVFTADWQAVGIRFDLDRVHYTG